MTIDLDADASTVITEVRFDDANALEAECLSQLAAKSFVDEAASSCLTVTIRAGVSRVGLPFTVTSDRVVHKVTADHANQLQPGAIVLTVDSECHSTARGRVSRSRGRGVAPASWMGARWPHTPGVEDGVEGRGVAGLD